jgi:tRNA(adenine34) deaminase
MELSVFSDDYFMKQAMVEAQRAFDEDEVPVGAVVVCKNQIIARAHNQTEQLNDVTAHAEMLAFTSAANFLGGKFLNECTLYVTLEPCCMCAGAAYWTRLKRVVFGSSDPKRGYSLISLDMLHPKTIVSHGILAEESRQLLQSFFEKKR